MSSTIKKIGSSIGGFLGEGAEEIIQAPGKLVGEILPDPLKPINEEVFGMLEAPALVGSEIAKGDFGGALEKATIGSIGASLKAVEKTGQAVVGSLVPEMPATDPQQAELLKALEARQNFIQQEQTSILDTRNISSGADAAKSLNVGRTGILDLSRRRLLAQSKRLSARRLLGDDDEK